MKTSKSYTCRIWIAGDYDDAIRALREFCEEGACFAVTRADYIYTGGAEAGVCITRINYPRFPQENAAIYEQCVRLAHHIRAALFQDSFSIETPDDTHWFTRRDV